MGVAQVEDAHGLPAGDADLDDEAASGLEVRGGIGEARHLRVLGRQVADRVEDEVDQRERALDERGREVADRDGQLRPAGLRSQLGDHVRREVDRVDRHTALCERKRDPPGPDPKLERGTVARSLRQELDRLGDDRRVAPLAEMGVVALGDLAREPVPLAHPDRFSFPCFFA
jgi:hypothetical protein